MDMSPIGHANVPLYSTFHETLYETSHGNIVEVKKYRPQSSSTVYGYNRKPIETSENVLGKPTRGSILANLKRSESMQNIISRDSWLPDNKKLCNIRYYYRLDSGKNSPEKRYPKIKDQTNLGFLSIRGQAIGSILQPKNSQRKEYQSKSVNTGVSYWSIKHWHDATWQKNLPEMYKRPNIYDPYASTIKGSKIRPSRFRQSSEM